ncbi:MAG TPA: hypothetical protein VIY27_05090 [Myxococcota bacterium]
MPDATIANHGSVVLLYPATDAARAWLDEHIPDDAQWFGRSLAIEPRYVAPIVAMMRDEGLTVGPPCGTCHGSGILAHFSEHERTCRTCLGHGVIFGHGVI